MGTKTPTGNWTRSPRLSAEQLHARAVARRDYRNELKTIYRVGDDAFWPPHRNRSTPARKHFPRSHVETRRTLGTIPRLSMMV